MAPVEVGSELLLLVSRVTTDKRSQSGRGGSSLEVASPSFNYSVKVMCYPLDYGNHGDRQHLLFGTEPVATTGAISTHSMKQE